MSATRIAVVQRPPALLHREETIARAVAALEEAAADGASLVVFPETYVPGYPAYIWRLTPGKDYDLSRELHGRLLASAVDLEADHLGPVREAAARLGVTTMIGVHELDARFSRATLFNTLVTIGPDGDVLNRHRKLVPTNPERMVWAPGDASGLHVVDAPFGRLGGLICWESYMPLARYSLYAQGVEVYVAPTWDEGDGWISTMRHIAREGRCWVVGAGCSLQARDVPDDVPERERLFGEPDAWINDGDSVVVSPAGKVIAGPLHREHGVLTVDIDVSEARTAHYTLDAAGHYNRPDVFSLRVNRAPAEQVAFDDAG
jgi:nitrilase